MQYTRVKQKQAGADFDPRVYADLDALIRLQFKTQGFSFLPRQPVHSVLFGRHASRLRGRGLNFEELRAYLPGDDIRALDWKVTARTRQPHVRVYTEERDRPVWLLIDQRSSMFFGSRERMKSVTAAEAAALAAWRTLAVGDRVGALIFDDQGIVEIRPHRSARQVMRILAALTEKNHALRADRQRGDAADEQLNRGIKRVLAYAKHDCLICLIGDGAGSDETTQRLVTQLTAHNDVLFAFIYDPLEAGLPKVGRLTVSDGAAQLEIDTARQRLRRDFAAEFQQRLQYLQILSRKHAIPLLALNTAEPTPEQVRDQLGYRQSPRRI